MFRNYNGKVVEFRGNQAVVYKHLKKYGHLTPLEAIGVYGIYRLAPRVCELRSNGVPIKTDMMKDARGNSYARYTISPNWKIEQDRELAEIEQNKIWGLPV